jgi:phosphate transport system substrate-binding protein
MKKIIISLAACGVLAMGVAACGDDDDNGGSSGGGDSGSLSGTIRIDGSSTVGPFAQAAQEAFQAENPEVRITVAQSGTGGGFEKFCAGETDISNASRPIDEEEEVPLCDKEGVKFTEVQVANDGISIATNPELEVDCLTTDELKQIWEQGSKVTSLSQVKPSLPDAQLSLFGPGTDSGTFEFFTEEINGEEGNSRQDYQPSEDDNVLVQGVSGEAGGMGYFGFSYYEQNQDSLGLVGVDAGSGCVKPSLETIASGEYKPLSRPLFMYPSQKAMARPEVKAFMEYVVENYEAISEAAAIVPMSAEQAEQAQSAVAG